MMRHAGLSDLRSWRLRSEGRQVECSFFSLFRIAHFSSWRAVEKLCTINLSPESQWISWKHHTWPSVCRAETRCSQQGGNEQLGGSLSQARERYWCFKDLQVYNLQTDFQNCSTKHLQTKKKVIWLVGFLSLASSFGERKKSVCFLISYVFDAL